MKPNQNVLLAAILLLSANMRIPILVVSPLLPLINQTYHLTNSESGLLTSIPLLVFGLLSMAVPNASKRLGLGRFIILAIIAIGGGEFLRYLPSPSMLFTGTLLLALGITVGNVMIPAMIRGFFPNKVNAATAYYTALMQGMTTLALLLVVPMTQLLGWRITIVSFGILSIFTLLLWLRFYNLRIADNLPSATAFPLTTAPKPITSKPSTTSHPTIKSVFSQRLAWDISLFMGVQSLVFYTLSTWIPTAVLSHHLSLTFAGQMASLFQFIAVIASLLVPFWLKKHTVQSWPAVWLTMCYLIASIGFFWGSGQTIMILSSIIGGIGSGGTFAVALLFFSLRTQSAESSAIISGTGQSIGYLLAAIGPSAIGYLYDSFNGWSMVSLTMIIFCLLFAYFGYRSGKNTYINE